MNLLLDTGILGQLCHPSKQTNRDVADWVNAILESGSGVRVYVPEICDYELRRKLLHLIQKGQQTEQSLQRLDDLSQLLEYLPLDTAIMRKAAELWCDARLRGQPTAAEAALDGDVILAAQARSIDGTIITTNRKHLAQFVSAREWKEIVWAYCFVCIRGPIDNLAFDWPGHFIVQDSQGRNWHCRHEVTWNTRSEIDSGKLVQRLNAEASHVGPMYQKLFSSGFGTTEPTSLRTPILMSQLPSTESDLMADLRESLGDDSD